MPKRSERDWDMSTSGGTTRREDGGARLYRAGVKVTVYAGCAQVGACWEGHKESAHPHDPTDEGMTHTADLGELMRISTAKGVLLNPRAFAKSAPMRHPGD
jgi:hypothetical protein